MGQEIFPVMQGEPGMGKEKFMWGGGKDLILRPRPSPLPSLVIRPSWLDCPKMVKEDKIFARVCRTSEDHDTWPKIDCIITNNFDSYIFYFNFSKFLFLLQFWVRNVWYFWLPNLIRNPMIPFGGKLLSSCLAQKRLRVWLDF